MFHRSERLFLRPAWPEDWQALFGGIADEGVVRNLARAPWPYTAGDARAFASRGDDSRFPTFMLTLPHPGGAQLVGCAGLAAADMDGADAELGYWIARPHWGRGYATEASLAVLEVAAMLGHRRIEAGHYIDNPASGRVLRKAGFEATGRVQPRDCLARGQAVEAAIYVRDLQQGCVALKAA